MIEVTHDRAIYISNQTTYSSITVLWYNPYLNCLEIDFRYVQIKYEYLLQYHRIKILNRVRQIHFTLLLSGLL